MLKLDLTIAEMCEILETETVNISAATRRRKVKLCTDSRKVEKGSVFWPICGERFAAFRWTRSS